MRIYHFDDDGVFINSSDARQDPLDADNFLIPRNATTVAPPPVAVGEQACFADGAWSIQAIPTPEPEPAPAPLTFAQQREIAYGEIGAQLDMLYWDGVNGTTVWRDHIAAVKAAYPKPA